MTRHYLPLPLPPGLLGPLVCLLLTVHMDGALAARFVYSNLHRDVYLDLIGQSLPFITNIARSTLEAALEKYGPTFVTKFSDCIAEFTDGDTKVNSMSEPDWKVYTAARQYPNPNGDGYLQQVQWKAAEVVFVGAEDVTEDDIARCTRRAFNIGKSAFVPLLLAEDADSSDGGVFQNVQRAKVVPLADFAPPPPETTTAEDIEAETANDVLAESELIENVEEGSSNAGEPSEEPPAEEMETTEADPELEESDPEPVPEPPTEIETNDLPHCPVKVKVDCRTADGSEDCNDLPMPENPDCKIKVKYSYTFTVQEEIRLQSARRYRKGSYQGCNNFELCEIREYLENYHNKYVRRGTEFDAWEEVCEDTRHDTLFEMRGQMETYYGSLEWIDCVVSDEYEDKVWSKKQTRGYLDLMKTNKVESISTEAKTASATDDPTGAPTASPTSSFPTSSPTSSPVAFTGSPVGSESVIKPEEFLCNQISLAIGCSTADGVDCNEVAPPSGTESDPCTVDVKYTYSVENVGNTGDAEFSKLMRSRSGANSEDIDFLPFFDNGLVLGQAYTAGAASMTENTSVDFCQAQTQVTVLIAEAETARGGACNTVEEYILMTPVAVPLDVSGGGDDVDTNVNTEEITETELSQDGFDNVLDSTQVSKEGREDVVTVAIVDSSDGASSMVIAQSQLVTASSAAFVPSPLSTTVYFGAGMAILVGMFY